MAVKTGRTSTASRTKTLQVGDKAPDFELPGHRNRERVRLSSFHKRRHVVIAFYPLDWTGT
jgi:peroxiredoxin